MKKLIILLITFTLNSCIKSDNPIDTMLPDCIEHIIGDSNLSNGLKTVRIQEVDNELHYWLNTDNTHFDGVEYIVNSKCDTICSFCGECLPPACTKNYNRRWGVIWEK